LQNNEIGILFSIFLSAEFAKAMLKTDLLGSPRLFIPMHAKTLGIFIKFYIAEFQ
jgi:hypothetical protein